MDIQNYFPEKTDSLNLSVITEYSITLAHQSYNGKDTLFYILLKGEKIAIYYVSEPPELTMMDTISGTPCLKLSNEIFGLAKGSGILAKSHHKNKVYE